MGTSKSSEQGKHYIAGVSIFSGRPDPTWIVSQDVAERLQSLWDSLEEAAATQPQPPPLGYRGCFLRDTAEEREWVAYKRVVTLKTPAGNEARRDEKREFESLLLKSAPEGLIPLQILEAEGL
jgi:hypothetical protein